MNILSVITQILVLINAVVNTVITFYRVKKVIKKKKILPLAAKQNR